MSGVFGPRASRVRGEYNGAMQNGKPVIGVDFDDVLIRTNEALAEYHNATYGTSYTREEVESFDLEKIWQCTPEEARRRIDEFIWTEFHHDSDAVLGAREALAKLNEAYDVVVVTGRREEGKHLTENLLDRHFLGLYRELHFTAHDDPDPTKRRLKSEVAKAYEMTVFIDDALKFAEDVASSGIPVLLFDTPWNRGVTPEGVTRVHSWDEILGLLLPPQEVIR